MTEMRKATIKSADMSEDMQQVQKFDFVACRDGRRLAAALRCVAVLCVTFAASTASCLYARNALKSTIQNGR